MICPNCQCTDNKVIDSRTTREGKATRRRRECSSCGHRYTTYEYVEMAPRVIVKNDGSKEPYDEGKLLAGLYSACKKRPISKAKIQELMEEIESAISKYKSDEIPSMFIGERVMKGLAALDEVAYMRFASVYQNFKEVSEFVTAVDGIPSPKETLR